MCGTHKHYVVGKFSEFVTKYEVTLLPCVVARMTAMLCTEQCQFVHTYVSCETKSHQTMSWHLHTVEPLLKDSPAKGHHINYLFTKDTF